MGRIEERFRELKSRSEKALVCFMTAGNPYLDITESLIVGLAESGADIIEIGIPFSDPLADGPSIQAASLRSLERGTTPKSALEMVGRARKRTEVPMVLMTYFNPVQKLGLKAFAEQSAAAGADGVILTDLPPEEAGEWKSAADAAGLATVFLLAPTSTDERIERVAALAGGFIYCVSRTGVTGAQSEVSTEVEGLVERIRRHTDKPVAVGFGVSKPKHVRQISAFADGVVVGSALVDLIVAHSGEADLVRKAGQFAASLKQATRV